MSSMPNPSTWLVPLPVHLKSQLRDLLTPYLEELSALEGVPVERDENGHARYRYLDDYWLDPRRIPLGIWQGDELVGFCLLRDTGAAWHVAEFGIARPFRRSGIGTRAVDELKALCRGYSKHDVLEANTQKWNPVGMSFWRAQGFVTVAEEGVLLVNAYRLR